MSNWLYPQTLLPLCLPPNLQTETSSSEDVLPLKLNQKKTDRQTNRQGGMDQEKKKDECHVDIFECQNLIQSL
jgi:hypothetical protein